MENILIKTHTVKIENCILCRIGPAKIKIILIKSEL